MKCEIIESQVQHGCDWKFLSFQKGENMSCHRMVGQKMSTIPEFQSGADKISFAPRVFEKWRTLLMVGKGNVIAKDSGNLSNCQIMERIKHGSASKMGGIE